MPSELSRSLTCNARAPTIAAYFPESVSLPRRRNQPQSAEDWCISYDLAEPLVPFQPGYVFGERYRVDHLLARGGHGVVFVAEHLPTERLVALKLLWPHLLASEDDAECLELEAKVAGRVKSEFIVRVLDAGVDAATYTPFLAMELLEGRSLLRLIEDDGPLGLDEALRYLSHVAQGLDHAHRFVDKAGRHTPIIHRDLKPENLFLTRRENGDALVKISSGTRPSRTSRTGIRTRTEPRTNSAPAGPPALPVTLPKWSLLARSPSATCSQPWRSHAACPCFRTATSWVAACRATVTPIATILSSTGSIGS
jgi:serine/threonine protein kinase